MSYDKMEVSSAEKEASEVLRSLLSVERRTMDSKENIIVPISSMETSTDHEFNNMEQVQWHTPVMEQSVFNMTNDDDDDIDHDKFNERQQEPVIWQGHSIQIENGGDVASETILQELYPIVSITGNTQIKSELQAQQSQPQLQSSQQQAQEHQQEQQQQQNQKQPSNSDVKPIIKKEASRKRKKPASSGDEQTEVEDRNKLEDNPLQVKARLKKGCECKDNCYRDLVPENVYKHRLNIAELTKGEHDMYLMGVTMACLANPSETTRHKARRRLRASYVYQGRRVCLEAFLYLENVTHYQLKRIRHHVMTHGVAPRVHGNLGKKPYNTFPLDIYKHATEFLKQYLEQHTGGTLKDKKLFIHNDTRRNLFDAYREYGEIIEPGIKLMGYSTFRHFMKVQFPHIRFHGKKPEPNLNVPFKSGKCMSYDKNKDPAKIEAEKAKNEAKKAALEAKRKEKNQLIIQTNIQVASEDPSQHPQVVVHQQQLQTVQVSQNQQIQQVQAIQPVGQHQIVQQMNVQSVSEDSSSQPIEVIPLTVVQQPQQTYIVTPVSHLQTSVHGAWYSRQ